MAATATGDRLTIGALAGAAGVGVETVRYYQRRRLLAVPARGAGVRRYGRADAERIGFIKRAQALGFALEEVRGLLALQDGTDRCSIRRIAAERLAQIRAHLRDLPTGDDAAILVVDKAAARLADTAPDHVEHRSGG